jgi:hypothetical protein
MTRRSQPPYPAELRERAVRMVAEVTPNYDSQWAAINTVVGSSVSAPRRRCENGCPQP